ncbi:Hypothetical protein CINCED_3A011043 [Cinara cedri]|uniref:Uncharacterized protein n=1 Tax=Cinara cedri TaxID=506608 RepID=A0A5E4LZE9_9HEMI|nr:Hypothetical protein CINCED_3A011043 [Cinara cedri]
MITDYLLPEIEARDLDDIWFQQDGATCHTALETLALLREQFGYVKSKVYITKPTTIDEFEANIKHVIGQIPVEMLGRVIENWNFRMDRVRCSYGQHLKDIILKK